ncbi:TetR/AcrR family transcriptional regulator [Kitasatospora sp. GP82]|uniref:TetR/AcrR family transcriptional regulator n=1 Tax=Kitasatospora sp. GP82 TaxID=3035089 RepID=UPI0024736C9A|nr:TetR/AcrR family transcriptional regulator [Kitasatospora sp. GP82]MDH6124941.1 TetR/AcrR family transcriptional repressor of lmrAB and yxaGH operons [Kitasatospora sp. GP82]
MGTKGEETRARLIQATRALMEAQGYFGTGLNQVLSESGAPRGSLYFHFPAGKDQLVGQALTEAGQEVGALIAGLTGTERSPGEVVCALLAALGDRMERSDWVKGCPLATVALEISAGNEPLRRICADAYSGWQEALASLLVEAGRDHAGAEALAGAALALLEGALLLARVHRSRTPLDQAARTVELLLA